MYPIAEIHQAFNYYRHKKWAFTGQTAVKLHSAMLLHKRAKIGNFDVAIQTSEFPAFWSILMHMGYKPVRMMRKMYVFKRGSTIVKLHLMTSLPQHTSYNQRTPLMSLNLLSNRNKNVRKMKNFASTVKRSAGSLNNVD
jgi:hypothetical protein